MSDDGKKTTRELPSTIKAQYEDNQNDTELNSEVEYYVIEKKVGNMDLEITVGSGADHHEPTSDRSIVSEVIVPNSGQGLNYLSLDHTIVDEKNSGKVDNLVQVIREASATKHDHEKQKILTEEIAREIGLIIKDDQGIPINTGSESLTSVVKEILRLNEIDGTKEKIEAREALTKNLIAIVKESRATDGDSAQDTIKIDNLRHIIDSALDANDKKPSLPSQPGVDNLIEIIRSAAASSTTSPSESSKIEKNQVIRHLAAVIALDSSDAKLNQELDSVAESILKLNEQGDKSQASQSIISNLVTIVNEANKNDEAKRDSATQNLSRIFGEALRSPSHPATRDVVIAESSAAIKRGDDGNLTIVIPRSVNIDNLNNVASTTIVAGEVKSDGNAETSAKQDSSTATGASTGVSAPVTSSEASKNTGPEGSSSAKEGSPSVTATVVTEKNSSTVGSVSGKDNTTETNKDSESTTITRVVAITTAVEPEKSPAAVESSKEPVANNVATTREASPSITNEFGSSRDIVVDISPVEGSNSSTGVTGSVSDKDKDPGSVKDHDSPIITRVITLTTTIDPEKAPDVVNTSENKGATSATVEPSKEPVANNVASTREASPSITNEFGSSRDIVVEQPEGASKGDGSSNKDSTPVTGSVSDKDKDAESTKGSDSPIITGVIAPAATVEPEKAPDSIESTKDLVGSTENKNLTTEVSTASVTVTETTVGSTNSGTVPTTATVEPSASISTRDTTTSATTETKTDAELTSTVSTREATPTGTLDSSKEPSPVNAGSGHTTSKETTPVSGAVSTTSSTREATPATETTTSESGSVSATNIEPEKAIANVESSKEPVANSVNTSREVSPSITTASGSSRDIVVEQPVEGSKASTGAIGTVPDKDKDAGSVKDHDSPVITRVITLTTTIDPEKASESRSEIKDTNIEGVRVVSSESSGSKNIDSEVLKDLIGQMLFADKDENTKDAENSLKSLLENIGKQEGVIGNNDNMKLILEQIQMLTSSDSNKADNIQDIESLASTLFMLLGESDGEASGIKITVKTPSHTSSESTTGVKSVATSDVEGVAAVASLLANLTSGVEINMENNSTRPIGNVTDILNETTTGSLEARIIEKIAVSQGLEPVKIPVSTISTESLSDIDKRIEEMARRIDTENKTERARFVGDYKLRDDQYDIVYEYFNKRKVNDRLSNKKLRYLMRECLKDRKMVKANADDIDRALKSVDGDKDDEITFAEFLNLLLLFFSSKNNLNKRIETALKIRRDLNDAKLESSEAQQYVDYLNEFFGKPTDPEAIKSLNKDQIELAELVGHLEPKLKELAFVKWD